MPPARWEAPGFWERYRRWTISDKNRLNLTKHGIKDWTVDEVLNEDADAVAVPSHHRSKRSEDKDLFVVLGATHGGRKLEIAGRIGAAGAFDVHHATKMSDQYKTIYDLARDER